MTTQGWIALTLGAAFFGARFGYVLGRGVGERDEARRTLVRLRGKVR